MRGSAVRCCASSSPMQRHSAACAAGNGRGRSFNGVAHDDGCAMTVHFIGAGPGAADLITLRGRDLIAACPVCLYAGSLVPEALLSHCPPGARIVNTAPLTLDEIVAEIR